MPTPTAVTAGNRSTLRDGERRIVEHNGVRIGVFAVDGSVFAVHDRCPHQGAPLCAGRLSGTTEHSAPGDLSFGRRGRVLTCPWHHWEFDITTGESVFDPARYRVRTYRVSIVDDEILVHL